MSNQEQLGSCGPSLITPNLLGDSHRRLLYQEPPLSRPFLLGVHLGRVCRPSPTQEMQNSNRPVLHRGRRLPGVLRVTRTGPAESSQSRPHRESQKNTQVYRWGSTNTLRKATQPLWQFQFYSEEDLKNQCEHVHITSKNISQTASGDFRTT